MTVLAFRRGDRRQRRARTAWRAGGFRATRCASPTALHLDDLALATACIDGHDAAWEHFIREQRPGLYRAADALDRGGGARELADALYADLYGVNGGEGARRSLLLYYHGRSALGTWLRAVLAQRLVDRARRQSRLEPLPEETMLPAPVEGVPDPARPRRAQLIAQALAAAVASLLPQARWRLAAYYQQQLTLAQIGKVLGEHEATASRQLGPDAPGAAGGHRGPPPRRRPDRSRDRRVLRGGGRRGQPARPEPGVRAQDCAGRTFYMRAMVQLDAEVGR